MNCLSNANVLCIFYDIVESEFHYESCTCRMTLTIFVLLNRSFGVMISFLLIDLASIRYDLLHSLSFSISLLYLSIFLSFVSLPIIITLLSSSNCS